MSRGAPKTAPLFYSLVLVAFVLWLLNISLGSVPIPFFDIFRIFLSHDAPEMSAQLIIWESRLPNSVTAMSAGAGLAICGLMLQSLFRNPLAGPSILGITSGASLGVALVVLLTGGLISLPFLGVQIMSVLAALGGSLLILLILLLALKRISSNVTILILGLMLSYAVSSVVAILELFATKESLQQFVFWGFGSFSGLSWLQVGILSAVTLLVLVLVLPLLKPMNALILGETYAKSLGVNVSANRNQIIILTGLLAGTITAFCGPIAFLGMAVPHLARWIFRSDDHRILFPGTLLMGIITALACDLIARLPGLDWVLPLNAVTALFGAPVVLLIILRNRRFKTIF